MAAWLPIYSSASSPQRSAACSRPQTAPGVRVTPHHLSPSTTDTEVSVLISVPTEHPGRLAATSSSGMCGVKGHVGVEGIGPDRVWRVVKQTRDRPKVLVWWRVPTAFASGLRSMKV
eukprot:scaffold36307_cov124-Isochrysis_galbana.AAC.1